MSRPRGVEQAVDAAVVLACYVGYTLATLARRIVSATPRPSRATHPAEQNPHDEGH